MSKGTPQAREANLSITRDNGSGLKHIMFKSWLLNDTKQTKLIGHICKMVESQPIILRASK